MTYRDVLHQFFSILEARPLVGGLEISDSALRFVASASNFATSVRLAPGIVMEGRIQDEDAFLSALRLLRGQILGRKARTKALINTVVTLSSMHIYNQVFSLPILEGESLAKAVELNLKMALPGGAPSYSGWEPMSENRDVGKIEIISAFLDKNVADDMVHAMELAGFAVITIESRGISLARTMKYAPSLDLRAPSILVSADSSGLDVLVVQGGRLKFDYFNSWKDLQPDGREITLDSFDAMVARSINQVLNFYNAHWKEPVAEILVVATGLKEEVLKVASQSGLGIKVRELPSPVSPPVTEEWYVALGAAFRGRLPRKNDMEISLVGIDVRRRYEEEQLEHFLSFWQILVPAALTVVVLVFGATWLFLNSLDKSARSDQVLKVPAELSRQIDDLQSKARAFNQTLALINSVNSTASPKSILLGKILEITGRRGITVNRITFSGVGSTVAFSGSAQSEDDVRGFKDELSLMPGIKNVELPITNIRKDGTTYTFSVTFVSSI